MSGAIAMGTSKITGMGDPADAQDAATKSYVDSNSGTTYTAGTGITLTGTEFQLTDTNAKLNASDYTAADVLTKIKTVDGSGSGLDADTLDGVQASGFITTSTAQPSQIAIRNGSPTIYLRDTDHNSAMLHCNSDNFYVLRGGDDTTTWTQINGAWPMQLNLTNNDATFGGDVSVKGNLTRTAHHTGHLEGSYNNVASNGTKTNPIYTIGSNYNPNETTLGNMYGIGYTDDAASFISPTMGWGMYVAADGDARVMLSGQFGHGFFTGNVTAYASDERLKTNIKPIENALDKVSKIRGVTYDWVDNIQSEYDFHPSTMHETGVIAQEIQEVIPDAVSEAPMNGNYTKKCGTDHEFLTVQKDKIVPLLIEAIKELKAEIDELKGGD
jgi:hypothetical protein